MCYHPPHTKARELLERAENGLNPFADLILCPAASVVHSQGRDWIEFYTEKKVVIERWPKEWSRKF